MTRLISLTLAAAMLAAVPVAARTITVRTDRDVVQVSAPGKARCMATPATENAAAARFTTTRRAGQSLRPVRPNARLAQAAAKHACDMAQRGLMAHHGSRTTGPAQRVKAAGYRPSITAENIAAGPFDIGQVLGIWNKSPGHLKNMLLPQVSEYGIGKAIGADGKTVFWAAVYAAPRR